MCKINSTLERLKNLGSIFWPVKEAAMRIIVASPSCTSYHWGSLIVLCDFYYCR